MAHPPNIGRALKARSLLSRSVCPSVRHVKTNKRVFEIFLPSGSDTILVFSVPKGVPIFRREPPRRGRQMQGGMKNPAFRPLFSPISRSISETVIVRWAHAARQFVSIEFSFYPCNI